MRSCGLWRVTAGVRSGDNLGQSQQQSTSVGTIRFISSPHIPFYEELNCTIASELIECHSGSFILLLYSIPHYKPFIIRYVNVLESNAQNYAVLTHVCCLQTIISSSQHIETRSKRSKRTPPNIDGDSRAY